MPVSAVPEPGSVGLVLAGLLLVFPAVIEGVLDDALPYPHFVGMALLAALVACVASV